MRTTKSKIDFIIELLNDKRLSQSQREKLFSLTHGELKKLELNDELILEKIDALEKKIFADVDKVAPSREHIQPYSEKDISNKDSSLNNYINPRNTSKFLNEFNQNIILKSTTHEIDENLLEDLLKELNLTVYDYNTHVRGIQKEFEGLSKKYFVNIGLVPKFNEFLFLKNNKGWSQNSIRMSWKAKEIEDWCNQNTGKCPNPGKDLNYPVCSLKDVLELKDGTQLCSFNEVISHFKGQIEFRDGTDLKKIILKVNRTFFPDVDINSEGIQEGIRFYSDVEKVVQAYKGIVKMCLDHWEQSGKDSENKPKLKLLLSEDRTDSETRIIFSINHTNSIFGKTAEALLDRYGSSTTGLINKQINGLCDLTIKAEFPNNEFYEVVVWPDKRLVLFLDKFSGVQFDLIFYRLQ